MYAQVAVLTYQSPDINSYTYLVPQNLKSKIQPGQLVSVPFGKRNPQGIVLSTVNSQASTVYKIKTISSITLDQPLILKYQIELLRWLSFYYHAPMVNCLEAMLPKIPKKKSPQYMNYQLSTKNQTLVLVPTINHIPQTLAAYPMAKNYALYHNELKMPEKFAAWQKILSGNADFIFGSRQAIFTPCPNLKKIVIYNEHEGAYKDDQSPYFDTLAVAQKISQLTGTKLEIIDSSPKITSYFSHQENIKIPKLDVQTKIISMTSEKISGNRSAVSAYLEACLKKNKGNSLLFLNKKIEAGSLFCKNCQHQEYLNRQPSLCPNCQSANIWFNSLNIFSLAAEVRKLIPGTKVHLIAEGIAQQPNLLMTKEPSIDIATASVFYRLLQQKYALVAHIAADTTLNIVDFSSQEKTYFQITDLKKLASKLLVIQTYNPDHPVISAAALGNYKKFFELESEQRKLLSYPPYSLLIKLGLKGKNAEKLELMAEKLVASLKNLSTMNHLPLTVLGPYRPIFQTKEGRSNIILKIPVGNHSLKNREGAVRKLSPYFAIVPKDWKIIVEPVSLN